MCTPGQAISSGMDRINSLMGVCPQFDILWNELSGREHMHLYGYVKARTCIPSSEL